jgi:hypothetical protein
MVCWRGRSISAKASLTVATAAVVSATFVLASCSAAHPTATHPTATRQPGSSTSASASVSSAAARYLVIASLGNDGLEKDFDGLEGPHHNDLAAARADLRDAASVERLFDRRLREIPLPRPIDAVARALITANESRAALTDRAAASASIAELRRYEQRLDAANGTVEAQVRTLRMRLHLPPPDPS